MEKKDYDKRIGLPSEFENYDFSKDKELAKKEEQLREAALKEFPIEMVRMDRAHDDYDSNEFPRDNWIDGAKSEAAKQYHSSNDSVEGLREIITQSHMAGQRNATISSELPNGIDPSYIEALHYFLSLNLQKQQESDAVEQKFTRQEIETLQHHVHEITGNGEVMVLFNKLLGVNAC